jgi:hypothetical protein
MIIIMIIAMAGLVVSTGPGDYVSTKEKSAYYYEAGSNRK